jgi:hypothetical protein
MVDIATTSGWLSRMTRTNPGILRDMPGRHAVSHSDCNFIGRRARRGGSETTHPRRSPPPQRRAASGFTAE